MWRNNLAPTVLFNQAPSVGAKLVICGAKLLRIEL